LPYGGIFLASPLPHRKPGTRLELFASILLPQSFCGFLLFCYLFPSALTVFQCSEYSLSCVTCSSHSWSHMVDVSTNCRCS
jgi:hypothetical protein